MLNRIRIFWLRKQIRRNPYIGKKNSGNLYIFNKGRFTIKYEILAVGEVRPRIKIYSVKHRMTSFEQRRERSRKLLSDFFLYRKWLYIFRPHFVAFYILGLAILYFGIVESYQAKVERLKWIVAKIIGTDPQKIEYSKGAFSIFGRRHIAYKEETEYVTFTLNPLNIFSSISTGYVTRWTEDAGYATNQVSYDDAGNIWLELGSSWKHGIIDADSIEWDDPQGIASWKVSGHQLSVDDQGLNIIDEK